MKNQHIELETTYTAQNYHPLDLVIVKGEGCYVYDDEGKPYIDMISAYSALNHGHCHPDIIKAVKTQLETLSITSRAVYHNKLGVFMKRLCELSGLDMALPMNTGAEAVETAIKAARLWGYRVKKIPKNQANILVAHNNFHGRTTTIVGFSSQANCRQDFGPYGEGFKTIPFNDIQALKKAITPNIAAFLVEPIQGEAGIILPDKGWLQEVKHICQAHNVLLLLDEVQTGLGRTGKMFAFEHEIDKPDGLIVGKALGGGVLPISAFIGRRDIMELFTPGSHGSTFGGNPLACVVGLEALDILERDHLIEKSLTLGTYFKTKLQAIKSSVILDVRGLGLWVGVEINPNIISARALCQKLLQKNVLTKNTNENVIRFAPPLIITQTLIDKVIACFEQVIRDVEKNHT